MQHLKKTYLLGFLCFYFSFCAKAQYQYLLHKTYAQRVQLLINFYRDTVGAMDSAFVFDKINTIKNLAENNNDEDLLLETGLMRANYFFYRAKTALPFILPMLDSLKNEGIQRKKIWLEAMAENMEALYNFNILQQYEIGFEHHERVYNLIKNLPPADFPHKQNCLSQMAEEYYYFRDFREAAFYNIEALKAEPSFKMHPYPMKISILNTLGLCYQQLNNIDSSDYYFRQTFDTATRYNSRAWQGISSGNIGYNFFLKHEYGKAIPLLQKDVQVAVENNDWGLASGSLMVLANIALNENNLTEAGKFSDTARQYVYRTNGYSRFEKLYPLLSKLYAAENNPSLASTYLDSALFIKDSLNRKFNALQMLRAKQKVTLEQYKSQLNDIENRRRINTIERNILIVAIIFLLLAAVYVYKNQRGKYLIKQQEFKKAEEELAMASRQLNDFSKNIADKNALIEMLQQQQNTNNNEAIKQLQQSTILTDADWEFFRELFEKVHAGFLQRLKEKMPLLTPAEIRFMVLSRLKLSGKEMAGVLGIGTDSIRQHRSRLRKKLNLSEASGIEDLAEQI